MQRKGKDEDQPPSKKLRQDNSAVSTSQGKTNCQNKGKEATPLTSASDTVGTSGIGGNKGGCIFKNYKIFILQAGIGKARTDLFRKQITTHGGIFHEKLLPETTTLVVDEKMEVDRLCRILKMDTPPEHVRVVKSVWLSTCLKEKNLVSTSEYEIDRTIKKVEENVEKKTTQDDVKARQSKPGTSVEVKQPNTYRPYFKKSAKTHEALSDADSDYEPSGGEDEEEPGALDDLTAACAPKRPLPKGSWACAQASSQKQVNHNKAITDKLEALAEIYENTNDRWRALGYQKGIAALKRYPKRITTFEEAKAIQGVGDRLASKIWEIIESGELRKLDEIGSSEEVQAINVFTKIWGAGAATARQWVSLGYRTLDDIRTKAKLTRHQQIGLKYYDDLNERMLREEASQIAETVYAEVAKLDPALICMACGSYRRGKETCGDVDVLVTHPDGRSHSGVFTKLINNLHEIGFLTDDLVTNEENGLQKKYMGVCKLPGDNTKHRRLDVIVVPYDEYACALMYFTGSAHFNRSMRHLAGKMGMSLSEHSLNVGVVRSKGEKITKGSPLPTPTEESIFKHLGLAYRTPDQRNH